MWKEEQNNLVREFVFADFKQAFAFMEEVARVVNEMDHHPDWSNVYNKVIIKLSTHDAGNAITDKDRELALKIDEIYEVRTA